MITHFILLFDIIDAILTYSSEVTVFYISV